MRNNPIAPAPEPLPTPLHFTINGVEISLCIVLEKTQYGMYVLADEGSDNIVRVAWQRYWAWDRLIFCLCHEWWHLQQKKQGRIMAIKNQASGTGFENTYSAFNKAEEESEAFALLCTLGEGMTGPYFFRTQEQVSWIYAWWQRFKEMGYSTPEPLWVVEELVRRTPPPVPPV